MNRLRDSEAGRASQRVAARGGKKRLGYAYLHNAVDDHSRLAYTEVHYNETAETCAGFWFRAVKFFQGPPTPATSGPVGRPVVCQAKVERYNQIMMAEWLYVRPYDSEHARTEYLADFLNYYNYERRHSAIGFKPPASRVPISTFRILPQSEWLQAVDIKEFEHQGNLFDLFDED